MQRGRSRILYVSETMNACAWYRSITPGKALADHGHHVRVEERLTSELVEWADLIVLQRVHDPNVASAIGHCKARGKLTIYELDDDLWNVHRDSGAHTFYSTPEVLKATEDGIRAADRVTTTTDHLAVRLRTLNRNVYVLPNMLPDAYWDYDQPVVQSSDLITIGWAGTNTHLPDLKLLGGVIEQLLDRYPNVEFRWAGMREIPFRHHERMRPLSTVLLEEYPDLLGSFHIGLAPVVDSVFNRSKSDLKFVEYAGRGIPVIASRTEAYQATLQHGVTGFLAKNPKDWLQFLTRLIEDVDLRTTMGRNAMEYARTRMISRNIGLWERAYGLDELS